MMVGFIQGPAVLRDRLGCEPAAADVLRYVKDEGQPRACHLVPATKGRASDSLGRQPQYRYRTACWW